MAGRYGLRIRAATGADSEGLSELLGLVALEVAPSLLARQLEAMRLGGHGSVLLAVEWGPPSGVLAFHWFPTLGDELPTAQIDLLAVAPDERRKGIARTLLKSASQAARMAGCGSLLLAVSPHGDDTLTAFCNASGFEPRGTHFLRPLRKAKSGP